MPFALIRFRISAIPGPYPHSGRLPAFGGRRRGLWQTEERGTAIGPGNAASHRLNMHRSAAGQSAPRALGHVPEWSHDQSRQQRATSRRRRRRRSAPRRPPRGSRAATTRERLQRFAAPPRLRRGRAALPDWGAAPTRAVGRRDGGTARQRAARCTMELEWVRLGRPARGVNRDSGIRMN